MEKRLPVVLPAFTCTLHHKSSNWFSSCFWSPSVILGGHGPALFSVSSWELENYLEAEFLCSGGSSYSQTFLGLTTVLMYSWEYIGEQDIHHSPSQGVYIVVLPVAMAHLPVKMSFRQNKKLTHQECC